MGIYFKIDNLEIRDNRLFFVLGPCVIENEKLTLEIAEQVKKISDEIDAPFIFKASFDKANRSSIHSFRGPGIKKGLKIYWQGNARISEHMNKRFFEMLYNAGCRRLLFGVESGSQRILNDMNKGTNVHEVTKVIKRASSFWPDRFWRIFCGG